MSAKTSASRRCLLKGEEAIVLAAAVAGADLYGYPITPVTGVVELASKLFPAVGRVFLQAESELAAANMAYGASAVGQRVLCVSSSPGVSLKQEAISYMCGAELPGVFVNAMRGGPGLGNIGASQADYFQATRGGGHGDYYTPVFAPATVGETFSMTLEAFNVADRYRTPVMVLIDGSIAQSTESVQVGPDAAELVARFDKPWAATGAVGRNKNVVSSFRLEPLEALENLNILLQEKYDRIGRELGGMAATALIDDAELLVVAYGSMAGLALAAVHKARAKGIKAGLVRPQTLWPFPSAVLREAAWRAKAVLVLEMSAGQMLEDVRLALGDAREIFFYGRMGGIVPVEQEILEQIEQVSRTAAGASAAADFSARTRLLEREHIVRRLPRPTHYSEPAPMERRYRPPADGQNVVVARSNAIEDVPTHYCPGCGHGNLHQIIAHAIDELGLRETTIMVEPVGCSVVTYWNFDTVQAAHGRGMALASAISRTHENRVVISYQGDGDLASIGMAETMHAASRGEDFVLIFVNNCIYGMTGGQMAPTSIPGLPTTTCDAGRDVADVGAPIDMCKLFAQLDGVVSLERVAINGPAGLNRTARAIKNALKFQADGVGGLKVVEVLSPCPVGWKMSPVDSQKYITDVISKQFPPGKFKEPGPQAHARRRHPAPADAQDIFDRAPLHWVQPADGYAPRQAGRFAKPGLRLAGHGGQGIVLLSGLVVHAAVRSGRRVSLLPSYGSAMRGGTCNCQVRISDATIASPYVSAPDIVVAMNQPSYATFGPTVADGGLLLFDSTLVTDPDAIAMPDGTERIGAPITKMAAKLGNERMANIVAAGVLVAATDLLDPAAIRDSIPEIFAERPRLIEPNLAAFEAGLGFGVQSAKSS
ncbi:MAG: hypothetical protein BIFFINMI_01640 [Phycisphaerae bacterium]|nr:hypothetical protein [Phycisphaerae bacterium]